MNSQNGLSGNQQLTQNSYLRNVSPRTTSNHTASTATHHLSSSNTQGFGGMGVGGGTTKIKSTYQSHNSIPHSTSNIGGGGSSHTSTLGRKQQSVSNSNANNNSGISSHSNNSHGLKHVSSSNMTNLSSTSSKLVHRQGLPTSSQQTLGSSSNMNSKLQSDFEISPKHSATHQTFSSKSSKVYGLTNRNTSAAMQHTSKHSESNQNVSQQQQSTINNQASSQQQLNTISNITTQPVSTPSQNSTNHLLTQGFNDYNGNLELNQILGPQNYPQSVKNNTIPINRQQTVIHNSSKDIIMNSQTHAKSNSHNHYGFTQNFNQLSSQTTHNQRKVVEQQTQILNTTNNNNKVTVVEIAKIFDKTQANRIRDKLDQLVQAFEYERMFCDQIPQDDSIIENVVCDLENQRVVRADADRSRGSENLNKDNIELILTLYCKRNNTKYKQGMNEILAPFVYLQQQCGFDQSFSYNCYSAFIWRYLTTFYQDEEFLTLQAALTFLQLLFKYHDPELAIYLESNQVTPEMYAIPWFLTYFAKAQQLQDSTPYSFKELPEIKQIFSVDLKQQNKEQIAQILEKIENIPCLPVMAEELFFYAYPEILSCSNPKCMNSLNGFKFNQSLISGLQSPTMSTQNSAFSIVNAHLQTHHNIQGRRQSLGLEEHDLMSPIREQSMKQTAHDDSYQVQYQQQQRRMTAADTTNRAHLQLLQQQRKAANIHDIIKKEINHKNQQLNTRMTSNQTSPIKGQQHLQINDQEYYKGIDISSSRSPFKNMNKQSPAKADGMPLETDSNVYDDGQEQQESHIDLINETTRMKHLAQTEEQKLLMMRRGQHNQLNQTIMTVQEPRIGSSPKAHLSTYMGSFKQSDKVNSLSKPSTKSSYKQGLSSSACKVSKLSNTTNLGGGSLIDNKRISMIQPSLLQTGLSTINFPKLDLCKKCTKKKEYEEKQQLQDSQDSEFQISIQETNQILEEESHDFYYEKIRFLIVDCRLEALQKEALLPNSFQLSIQTECNIEYLQEQTDKLLSCKDIYHVCLVGLDPFQPKFGKKLENNGENFFDIKAYHESIVRFLIEDFQSKGFKYISVIPGGFKECHELSLQYNFQILNHDKGKCYHCDAKSDKHQYDQQFNIASDIFSGFKHWYDVANTKIKSFVKGPIKMLGNQNGQNTQLQQQKSVKGNQSIDIVNNMNQTSLSSNNSNIYSSLVVSKQPSESRNNGPHKQGKHQHKTTDDQNKLTNVQNQSDQDNNYQITTSNNMIMIIQSQDNQSEKVSELSLGSLPISFVSQSSRQELFSQLQGSSCSSNVSVNSSQNDGNNLRDAISNKKIMSYKLMSKVPGDRNDIQQYQQASLEEIQQLNKNQVNVQYLVSDQKSNQISTLNPLMFKDHPNELQILVSPLTDREYENQSEEQKSVSGSLEYGLDLNDQNAFKIELTQQSSKSSTQSRQQQLNNSKDQQVQQQLQQQQYPPVIIQPQEEQKVDQAQIIQEYYNINGLTKCFDMSRHEFEMITTKKTSIVYKCLKLHLRKKQDPPQQVLQQQQLAYQVSLIITPYSVSVLKENLKLKTSMSFLNSVGIMNQSIESSLSHIDEWDQTDFDELHPQLQDNQDSKKNRIIKQGGNQGPFAYLESRFLMHDLIKITSRKSSTKIITFYFRIPLIQDYSSQILESNLVTSLDQKPAIKYQFAFKRKTFKEVSMSFEFAKEDEAKQCIENVSTIYKKLKNKKS